MTSQDLLTDEFRALSAALGQDPLQVQGPGGNTSIKDGNVMWIKASGTELANAETQDIFVAVDRDAAKAEANGAGDGSCKATVLDPAITLRPSIETTFHAALNHGVVAHSHSIVTIAHVISPQGRALLADKLSGLNFVVVPYAKPGLPLTRQILSRVANDTQVILLQNHGLICCGASVAEVKALIADVESRLQLPISKIERPTPTTAPPAGFVWAPETWLAIDETAKTRAVSGTYYPDHTASQKAMLTCVSDVLRRIPNDWTLEPIGQKAEAELLNWDAEKYRQALAARS